MSGRFVFGRRPVAEALRSGEAARRLLLAHGVTGAEALVRAAEGAAIPVERLARTALSRLVGPVTHQGVVLEVAAFAYASVETILQQARRLDATPLVIVADCIQDPHNLGSLVRSALAFGAHGVIVPKDRACEVTPTVTKAAAGATAHLPIARVTNVRRVLRALQEAGLWIVGTAPQAERSLPSLDLRMPLGLVIGSEGSGMRRTVSEGCDHIACIPMPGGLASLNAAVAGAIALYEVTRQRQATPA